jgi:hypothetical protein
MVTLSKHVWSNLSMLQAIYVTDVTNFFNIAHGYSSREDFNIKLFKIVIRNLTIRNEFFFFLKFSTLSDIHVIYKQPLSVYIKALL